MGNLGKFLSAILVVVVVSCADKNNHRQFIEMEADQVSADSLVPTKATQCVDSNTRFNLKRASVQLKQKINRVRHFNCLGDKVAEKWIEEISPKDEMVFPAIKNADLKFYAPEYHIINSATCDKVILKEEMAMKPKIWVDINSDSTGLHVVNGSNVIQYEVSICSPSKKDCRKRVVVDDGSVVLEVDFSKLDGSDKTEFEACFVGA